MFSTAHRIKTKSILSVYFTLYKEILFHFYMKIIFQPAMIFCLDLYDFSRQTWETPLHYCARAGNEDILLEIVKHIGALGVQKAVNKQSKVNSQTHWCIRCTGGS
jgi:hypothetical protein